jgi:hypothetical protein
MALTIGLHRIEELLAVAGLNANIRAFYRLTLRIFDNPLNGSWPSPGARNGEEQSRKPNLQ